MRADRWLLVRWCTTRPYQQRQCVWSGRRSNFPSVVLHGNYKNTHEVKVKTCRLSVCAFPSKKDNEHNLLCCKPCSMSVSFLFLSALGRRHCTANALNNWTFVWHKETPGTFRTTTGGAFPGSVPTLRPRVDWSLHLLGRLFLVSRWRKTTLAHHPRGDRAAAKRLRRRFTT